MVLVILARFWHFLEIGQAEIGYKPVGSSGKSIVGL